jgi:plasmid stabilization system protein ParE
VKLRLSEAAEADLLALAAALSDLSASSALTTINQIDRALSRLRRFPRAGHGRPDLADHLLALRAGQWLIIYADEHEAVVVRRIVHGSRDLRKLFG